MKRLLVLFVLPLFALAKQEQGPEITVVNGTNSDMKVALATDYNYYPVPDTGYMYPELPGPREMSPWLTDWVAVKKGKTERLSLKKDQLCPEYLIVSSDCKLNSKKLARFEGYDAITLVPDTKKGGQYGEYYCSGNVTVTFAEGDQKKNNGACSSDVTVSGALKKRNAKENNKASKNKANTAAKSNKKASRKSKK